MASNNYVAQKIAVARIKKCLLLVKALENARIGFDDAHYLDDHGWHLTGIKANVHMPVSKEDAEVALMLLEGRARIQPQEPIEAQTNKGARRWKA